MIFPRLQPRERTIVVCSIVALVLVLSWFVFLSPYYKTMERVEDKIAALEQNLTSVIKLRDQILEISQQLTAERQHSQGNEPFFSKLENLTEQTGVRGRLLSMRPQSATVQGEFRQQLVEVRMEKISLRQLVQFLYAVEYRSGGIQFKSMRIKPRFENRSLLDVNMVLMSLEKL